MAEQMDTRVASGIALDISTLKGETAGTDTRYALALSLPYGGPVDVDERWVAAYRLTQDELPVYGRFDLDRANALVRFSCRTVDGNGMVFEMLERLETLVARVNQLVDIWRAQSPPANVASATLRAR
jgi:hypothetical protein